MDTPPEPGFDRITAMAARLFEAPIALLTLVGADRLFFKSAHGLSLQSAPREQAFCARGLAAPGLYVVPDALADAELAASPMVAGPPHVRFYAGAPLQAAGGQRIGMLCVLDRRPRPPPDAEAGRLLQDLADTAVALLDARLRERQLAAASRTAGLHADCCG